jgi:hypothetical protein
LDQELVNLLAKAKRYKGGIMPSITINNKNEHLDIKSYRTLTELLPAIRNNYISSGEFLTGISVNGIDLIKSNEREYLNKPLDEISSIDIQITGKNSILLDSMDSFQNYISQIFDKIDLSVKFFENKQKDLGDTVLMDITDTLHTFISLITQVHQNLIVDSTQKLTSGNTIKQLEIHLLSVIKAILFAKKKNDDVMLTDLLEHELKDNLTQWKILAIPQIKKMNTI